MRWGRECSSDNQKFTINPLSPNMKIQILHTSVHTLPYRISCENSIKYQSTSPLFINLLLLLTFSFDNVLILLREIHVDHSWDFKTNLSKAQDDSTPKRSHFYNTQSKKYYRNFCLRQRRFSSLIQLYLGLNKRFCSFRNLFRSLIQFKVLKSKCPKQ